jgi:hypothetical protein
MQQACVAVRDAQERELQLVSCGKKLRMVEEAMESTLTCMSCMSVIAIWRCAASSQTTRPSACYVCVHHQFAYANMSRCISQCIRSYPLATWRARRLVRRASLGLEQMQNATIVSPCGHSFCEGCIKKSPKSCPDCEAPVQLLTSNRTLVEVCAKVVYQGQAIAALQDIIASQGLSSRRPSVNH